MRKRIPSIVLKPVRSKQLAYWYLFLYTAAVLMIMAAPMDWIYGVPMVCALLGLGYARMQGYEINQHLHVVEALIKSSGHARILLANGKSVPAKLRTDSLMTPWMVLLRFDLRNRWRHPSMILLRDSLPEDEMRRLRILLIHGSFHQNGE